MVNVKSVKNIKLPSNPTLFNVFEIQRKYNKIFNKKKIDVDTRSGQIEIKLFIYYIIEELMEASNCLKNRPWTKYETIVDKDHFQEEIIDAFDFFIALLDHLDINEKKLFDLYSRKYKVNEFRNNSKY